MDISPRTKICLCWVFVCIQHTIFSNGQFPISCGHPGAPANGTFSPNGATFRLNTTVKYNCNDGFILFGSESRTCLYNGSWTGDIPLCDRNIARGKTATQSGSFRAQQASLAIDGKVNTCASTPKTASERWWQLSLTRSHQVTMVAVTIAVGFSQDFSVYVVSTEGGDNRIVYNRCGNFNGTFEFNMVEIQCNNGTGIKGEYVFIRDNRQGAYHLSLCEVEVFALRADLPCGQPERPLKSVVRPYNQTVAHYNCEEGFHIEASPFLTCIEGMWESPPPRCVDVYCAAPPPVVNSKMTPMYAEWFPSPDRTHFPFGAILNYTCHVDYVQEGFDMLLCAGNGSWLGTQPKCWPTTCGHPPVTSNATVHFRNVSAPTAIGSFVELRCHEGTFPSNDSTVGECNRDGIWVGLGATCEAPPSAPLGEGLQPALGAIIAVVVVLAMVAMVVVAMVILRKRGYLNGSLKAPTSGHSNGGMALHSGTGLPTIAGGIPVIFDLKVNRETFQDQDALYDDVWQSDEALVDDTNSTLYTDAISSSEDLVLDDGTTTDRIYDQPDGCDAGQDDDHVYYSPLEGAVEDVTATVSTAEGKDRSELPPADGAAENPSVNVGAVDGDHIYEPLRRSNSPNAIVQLRKPVYAKVDLASKKQRRSQDDGYPPEMEDTEQARQPPEGVVAYTVPVFSETSATSPASGSTTVKRPLPPIPNVVNRRSSSVMVDNALYGRALESNSWTVVADNELYDGVGASTNKQTT